MRANRGRLDELVAEEGEFVISRRGQPNARIFPCRRRRMGELTVEIEGRRKELLEYLADDRSLQSKLHHVF